MKEKKIVCNEEYVRLDVWLQRITQLTRVTVQQAIKSGDVLVNGKLQKAAYLCKVGDEIVMATTPQKSTNSIKKQSTYKAKYLYEDKDIVVLEKPAGLLVHEANIPEEYSLVDQLVADGVISQLNSSNKRPGIVHRLDRMTEGLMVVTKTPEALESLKQQFMSRHISKTYIAALSGNMKNDSIRVHQPIGRHPRQKQKFHVTQDGKEAITLFEVIKRFNSMTLCKITPTTGRTHQIRVHAAFIGHPILDDPLYTKTKAVTGQRLQAIRLGFKHPTLKCNMSFQLPFSDRLGVKI